MQNDRAHRIWLQIYTWFNAVIFLTIWQRGRKRHKRDGLNTTHAYGGVHFMSAKISNVPVKSSAKPWIKQLNSSCCLSVSLAQKILSLAIPRFNCLHPAWQVTVSVTPLRMTKACHSTSDRTAITLGPGGDLLSSSQETICACNKMDKYFHQQFYSLYLSMANANISMWLDDGFVNDFHFVETLHHSFQLVSRVICILT